MKIGVAFSGSGAGAAAAHAFAGELEKCSLTIEMLSVTSLAAVPSLLWAYGLPDEEIEELTGLFTTAETPELGLRTLEGMGVFRKKGAPRCPLAVNSVDVSTGITAIFSDAVCSDAWNLKVLPLAGWERAALGAALSPYKESEPCPSSGMRLCDFSARYGCPFFPLKMAGMERLLSVNFAGGETPAQIAADSLASLTGRNADLHYTLPPVPPAQIRSFVREHTAEIYNKLLF